MSRLKLDWFNLTQIPGQDLCLKIPICDVYSVTIDKAFPHLNHIGWKKDTKGTCYTYIKTITDVELESLNNFLQLLQQIVCLTITDHLKPYFESEVKEVYALDFNFKQGIQPLEYTLIGELEHQAKESQSQAAIDDLADLLSISIRDHPTLAAVDIITAVPPRPSKVFHLPLKLVEGIGKILNRPVGLKISKKEHPKLKKLTVEDKIKTLQGAFALHESIEGKSILLVDDLYQSGVTLWSLAKFLKDNGAREVYGLACVKSWSDTDNI